MKWGWVDAISAGTLRGHSYNDSSALVNKQICTTSHVIWISRALLQKHLKARNAGSGSEVTDQDKDQSGRGDPWTGLPVTMMPLSKALNLRFLSEECPNKCTVDTMSKSVVTLDCVSFTSINAYTNAGEWEHKHKLGYVF